MEENSRHEFWKLKHGYERYYTITNNVLSIFKQFLVEITEFWFYNKNANKNNIPFYILFSYKKKVVTVTNVWIMYHYISNTSSKYLYLFRFLL